MLTTHPSSRNISLRRMWNIRCVYFVDDSLQNSHVYFSVELSFHPLISLHNGIMYMGDKAPAPWIKAVGGRLWSTHALYTEQRRFSPASRILSTTYQLIMLNFIENGTASAAVECPLTHFKSLTITEALPGSIQAQSKDKRYGRLFEDALYLTLDPEDDSEKDTPKVDKRVHWHDVVEEITLPYRKISRAELKYIRLNDTMNTGSCTNEENAGAVPSSSDVHLGGEVRGLSKGACTSQYCCVRAGGPSTPSTGLPIEHQGRQNRSNSDSRVQQLSKSAKQIR